MKNKLTEPKIESAFALLVHLFRRIPCLVAVVLICSSAPAQNLFVSTALEGIVKAPDGHPISNAQLRIEAKSGKFVKTTTTDARGHYFCDGLTAGTDYKVTVARGSIKAASASIKAQAGKPTKLDLEWGLVEGSPKRHMIWVPQETGTHIGSTSGRWVTVDETGQVVNDNSEVTRAGAKQLGNGATKNTSDIPPPTVGH
jgi:hypothetical protein